MILLLISKTWANSFAESSICSNILCAVCEHNESFRVFPAQSVQWGRVSWDQLFLVQMSRIAFAEIPYLLASSAAVPAVLVLPNKKM